MLRHVLSGMVIIFLIPAICIGGDLSKSYSVTVGEMIEMHCGIWEALSTFTTEGFLGSNNTATVYYSKGNEIFHVMFYGSRNSIDNAKEVLGLINEQVVPKVIEYGKKKFDVKTETSDFLLIYKYEQTDEDILMMENGNFVFPD